MSTFLLPDKHNYGWINPAILTLLTALSVLFGQSSVFYIIYLFWWNELLVHLVAMFFSWRKRKTPAEPAKPGHSRWPSFFMLGIYGIFIIVFFGFIANWDNRDIMIENFRTLLFRNVFFNLNLLFIAVELIWLHYKNNQSNINSGLFTPNMIVLHISIILGANIMMFIVKRYPGYFSPDNLWGSVLIIAPFLLLRYLSWYFTRERESNTGSKLA